MAGARQTWRRGHGSPAETVRFRPIRDYCSRFYRELGRKHHMFRLYRCRRPNLCADRDPSADRADQSDLRLGMDAAAIRRGGGNTQPAQRMLALFSTRRSSPSGSACIPRAAGSRSTGSPLTRAMGAANFENGFKYLAIDDPDREFLLTLGVNREWGATGTTGIAAAQGRHGAAALFRQGSGRSRHRLSAAARGDRIYRLSGRPMRSRVPIWSGPALPSSTRSPICNRRYKVSIFRLWSAG